MNHSPLHVKACLLKYAAAHPEIMRKASSVSSVCGSSGLHEEFVKEALLRGVLTAGGRALSSSALKPIGSAMRWIGSKMRGTKGLSAEAAKKIRAGEAAAWQKANPSTPMTQAADSAMEKAVTDAAKNVSPLSKKFRGNSSWLNIPGSYIEDAGIWLGRKGNKLDRLHRSAVRGTRVLQPDGTYKNTFGTYATRYAPGAMLTGSVVAPMAADAAFGEDSLPAKAVGYATAPINFATNYLNPWGLTLAAGYGLYNKAGEAAQDIGMYGAQMAGDEIGRQFAATPWYERIGAALSPETFQERIRQGIADRAAYAKTGAPALF